jgi:hypothetical protein
MLTQAMPRLVAAGVVVAAAGLVWLGRGAPNDEAPVELGDFELAEAPTVTLARADDPPEPDPRDPAAVDKIRELQQMSETFRNTTFLIAIRDAGFICNELLRVYGGVNDSTTWTATCSEMLAYTVSVASAGALHIEPTMQYWDGQTPAVLPREDRGQGPRLMPPQTLPPTR